MNHDRPGDTSPLLTLGLPVFNGSDFLRETLQSVKSQSFKDYELVISDNGSEDDTALIVSEFAATDSRIRYIRHPQNIGAHKNYNSIVPYARGEFFKWLAHDDLLAPDFLQECVDALDRRPEAVLAFTATDKIDESGNKVGELVSKTSYDSSSAYERLRAYTADRVKSPQIFGLIRRSVLLRTPLLGDFRGADLALIRELSMHGRFAVIDDHLFMYRFHDNRYSARTPEETRAWYEPGRSAPGLSTLHQFWRLLGAVRRVPMPLGDRVRCFGFAFYWAAGNSGAIWKELTQRGRFELGRLADRSQ
jgi:glycosyltransferase involved in cell wall biosynthesis